MSTVRKLSAEEELEKQYQEYKAQFLQWKERNRDSEGTDAYIRYVRQFHEWERDVERRRAAVRQKAEREKQAAVEREATARREAEAQRKKDEETAAKAYAEQQSQYIAMHQRAMQEEQKTRVGGSTSGAPLTIQFHSSPLVGTPAGAPSGRSPQQLAGIQQSQGAIATAPSNNDVNPMFNVMQQMLSFVMKAEKSKNGDVGGGEKQQSSLQFPNAVPPPVDSSTQLQLSSTAEPGQQRPSAPQLWGNEGASYLVTDPMFRRWNVRAAPPNFRVPYQPPPEGTPIVPGWLTQRRMKEEQLVFAPKTAGASGAASLSGGAPQSITALPPAASSSVFNVPPPNFAQPPPLFKI